MPRQIKKSLPETHLHLLEEWDYTKNGDLRPEDVSYGSNKKVWWKCAKEECLYSWQACIGDRTFKKNGCPGCSGRAVTDKNRFSILYPGLLVEWNYAKNYPLTPNDVSYASSKRVWWCCSKKECGYTWGSKVSNRTVSNRGCPACAGRAVSRKNNLMFKYPEVAVDWDYIKNYPLKPEDVLPGSAKKVWWVCSVCIYKWTTAINTKIKRKRVCPSCAGKVLTDNNRLSVLYPEVSLEWDYAKNYPLTPEQISFGSGKKVWWVCKKCGYGWITRISNRTTIHNKCPACVGQAVSSTNNLSFLYPEISSEWDYIKNIGLAPENFTYGSGTSVWWECSTCGYSWKTCIFNRTTHGKGCSICSSGPVSRVSQRWLNSLNIPDLKREYYIKDLKLRVDGFDLETNTVYEFLGDYWHGNPEVFPSEKINPTNRKSYGELYQETMERISILKSTNYKVIYIWESNFNKVAFSV